MKCLHRMRQIFRLPLHAYLLYLLVATFLFTGVTFSSYVTTASGGDSARVAAGVLDVSSASPNISLGPENPTAEYTFTVSNYKDGQCSEVAVQYDVTVTLDEPLPEGVSIQLGSKTVNTTPQNKVYSFEGVGTLPAGTEYSNPHTLSFSTTDSSALTATTLDVTITVHAEQID